MYDVKVYSLKAEGSRQITDHFRVYEFACKDGTDPVFVSDTLVGILEAIRLHFDAPVHINSAYRTPQHNAKEGGVKTSQHTYGLAADIRVDGHTPAEVYAVADSMLGEHGGVGIYDTFVHVDVRSKKSRFDYRKKK